MNGVRLHYLDWGGRGETLLLLTGMGNSAHIYDDLAPQFTDRFRVIALTRRGHGQSDKPRTGYDTETLVEDIAQFLDYRISGNRLNVSVGKSWRERGRVARDAPLPLHHATSRGQTRNVGFSAAQMIFAASYMSTFGMSRSHRRTIN